MLHSLISVLKRMEAIVAVLRPRHLVMPIEFRLESYDILLVQMRMLTARDKVRTMKQLPATNILLDDEPEDALTAFLYRFTGGDDGGITGGYCIHLLYICCLCNLQILQFLICNSKSSVRCIHFTMKGVWP